MYDRMICIKCSFITKNKHLRALCHAFCIRKFKFDSKLSIWGNSSDDLKTVTSADGNILHSTL